MTRKILMMLVACSLVACATVNKNPDKIILQSGVPLSTISVSEDNSGPRDFMRLTVAGETTSDTTLYYSVIWFDDAGMRINTTLSKPTRADLTQDMPFYWTAVAPNANAHTYKILVADRPIEQ